MNDNVSILTTKPNDYGNVLRLSLRNSFVHVVAHKTLQSHMYSVLHILLILIGFGQLLQTYSSQYFGGHLSKSKVKCTFQI